SSDAIYLARHVALRVGVPEDRPALTVNRLCGSGFEAVAQGAREILLGEADVCLTGGTESMSQAPHAVRGARWGQLRLGPAEQGFEDVLWEALVDSYCRLPMGETAEALGERYSVTRRPVRAGGRAGEGRNQEGVTTYAADEHIRADASLETLARLKPTFRKD